MVDRSRGPQALPESWSPVTPQHPQTQRVGGREAAQSSYLANTFFAMRAREVSACCFRSVRPPRRRRLPLPLPLDPGEPRSTPVAASTSLINSGSCQSAEKPRLRRSPNPNQAPTTACAHRGHKGWHRARKPLLLPPRTPQAGGQLRLGAGAVPAVGCFPGGLRLARAPPGPRHGCQARLRAGRTFSLMGLKRTGCGLQQRRGRLTQTALRFLPRAFCQAQAQAPQAVAARVPQSPASPGPSCTRPGQCARPPGLGTAIMSSSGGGSWPLRWCKGPSGQAIAGRRSRAEAGQHSAPPVPRPGDAAPSWQKGARHPHSGGAHRAHGNPWGWVRGRAVRPRQTDGQASPSGFFEVKEYRAAQFRFRND